MEQYEELKMRVVELACRDIITDSKPTETEELNNSGDLPTTK